MKDLLNSVATALTVEGMTVETIYDNLKAEGLSDYDAYLTYIGGRMIYRAREDAKSGTLYAPTVRNIRKVRT